MTNYPRAASSPGVEHAEVTMTVLAERDREMLTDLRHRVANLERADGEHKDKDAARDAATWRRIGLLQWAIGVIVAVVLGVGGGLLNKAYDAYGLLADRVIEVDQEGEQRTTDVTEKLTAAINSLTNQVVRLDERLSAMSARLSELDSRRASGAGSGLAGTRQERGERGTW